MEEVNNDALEKCILTAKSFGCPQEQVDQFLSHGYIPLPWQWEFHALARKADLSNGPVDIGTGGARGPGKSHAVLSQSGLDDCQRIDGLKGLFLRQTGIAAKESFDDLVDKVLRGRVKYRKSGNMLYFENHSRIVLGGFKDQSDIDKYIGIEYDFIIVEELNQLTEDKYTKLRGSLRTSKPNWRPRVYTSFNPGGIGHGFVKNRYIAPLRENREKETRFIGSTYKSNPYLNIEYIDYLESLTGDLGKAWREGEWDIFAGQYFDEWRDALHICSSFIPSIENIIVGGLDWGRTGKPNHKGAFSFHLAEISRVQLDSGIRFHRTKTFLEVYGKDRAPAEWWPIIKEKFTFYNLKIEDILWIQADTMIFTPGQDTSKSIADQFKDANEDFGFLLKPASKDRIGGWTNYHTWLRLAADGIPYYQVTSNCPHLIRTLPELIHDETSVEDVDTDGEDHAPDDQRYMLKKIKWIDSTIGGISHTTQPKYQPTVNINEKGQEVVFDLEKFGEINKGGVYYPR
jgi:phage terminase large subunit